MVLFTSCVKLPLKASLSRSASPPHELTEYIERNIMVRRLAAVATAGTSRSYTGTGSSYRASIVSSILARRLEVEVNLASAFNVQLAPAARQEDAKENKTLSISWRPSEGAIG